MNIKSQAFIYVQRIDSTEIYFFSIDLQGVVAFSSQGDRIALTQIEQMIDGKYVILGHYDTQADNLTWTGMEKWHDNKVIQISMLLFVCQFRKQHHLSDNSLEFGLF